ncbi:nucleolin-like [Scomber scombrus]|uniref:nucleolin-like n=1 Tax=Scomber scombrus TaxID=13677 RepID=UPI002DD7BF19|nr:nucleolin-like [Scomber scombrus]
MCKHSEVKLRAYPYVLILYLEKNMEKGKQVEENPSQVACVSEPQPKRRKKDSPLEDAIIQDLLKDMEAENRVSTVSRDNTHAEGEVMRNPGRADKDESGVNTPRGSSGDVSPGTTEDMEEEEEDDDDDEDDEDDEEEESDEEGENVDSVSGSPDKPGILTRLARHMFPFSLFFRDL